MKKKRMKMPDRARHPTASARLAGRVLNTGYSHGGASLTRQAMRGYNPVKSSTKSDVDANLNVLRNRSADMYINSPLGASAVNTSRAHIIGAGLTLSAKINYRILGLTPERAIEWQHNTRAEFDLWADSLECDLYRKNNFYDMQDIAFISYLVDGDAWAAIKYRRPANDFPYCTRVQLFEAARVCNPDTIPVAGNVPMLMLEKTNPQNGNRIINGIEIDDDGAVVAYWIANRYPYDPTEYKRLEWTRVEAFGKRTGFQNILQISHEERPEQYRGVPFLAPVIEELKQVSRFTDAELTAAIIKSYFTLFFKTESPGPGNMGMGLPEAFGPQEKVDFSKYIFELGAGTMNELPPGYDVKTVDASRQLSVFEPFTNALVSQIGAALGIPAEVLLSRFQSSYSAARGALLQFMAVAHARRVWFARDFCQPVYERWLAEAVAIGRIQAPGFFDSPLIRKAWSRADWFGPVMGMLDPEKEVRAAKLREEYGYSTGEREAAEMTGTTYTENIAQLSVERQSWRNNNLEYPLTKPTVADGKGGADGE
ncbi:MAG: phage portal protein [Acidaminococcaceae bacterium]|nr:phage portal protein [Acidaminococcaceae bacterium]